MAEDALTVLVTGASGFIATHIVQQLLQGGEYKVRGTVRSTKNEEKVAPLRNLFPDAKYPLELVEADLLDDKPWEEVVKGCTYVLHTASPFPVTVPKNEDELIKPAVEGTLNVLKACRSAGGVKRVVLTSSAASVMGGMGTTGVYSEENWTDVTQPVGAYPKSKTLAEKAAWDYVKELPDDEKFELVVMNPVYVVGPVLCGNIGTSQEIPKRLLERQMPMVPKIHFHTIDVRDVARAHINGMTIPEAAGGRHLLVHEDGWFKDYALILDEEFRQYGYKVPTGEAPNFVIKLGSFFDGALKMLVPSLGKKSELNSDKMAKVLGITDPISQKKSFIDMTYSMIETGKIKKTPGYKGPPSST